MSKDPFNEESSEKMSLEEKIEYEKCAELLKIKNKIFNNV